MYNAMIYGLRKTNHLKLSIAIRAAFIREMSYSPLELIRSGVVDTDYKLIN